MSSRGAEVSIDVKFTDEGCLLKIKSILGDELEIQTGLHREELEQEFAGLHDSLEQFRETIGDSLTVEEKWGQISRAIRGLDEQGRYLADILFGEQGPAVKRLFLRACPNWQAKLGITPRIEVTARLGDMIPIEFLPVFSFTEAPEIKDFSTLNEVLHRFVGFSTVVKRILLRPGEKDYETLPSRTMLENDPKLPLRFFYHAGLRGAQYEKKFFEERADWIDLDGPWPNAATDDLEKFIHDIADYVWDPAFGFKGNRMPPDQILHFACHCDTTAAMAQNYVIQLSHDDKSFMEVSIRNLKARFQHLRNAKPRLHETIMPLIFFNACGTSVINPSGAVSFPHMFLGIGSRGFIGTETKIPDDFAAAFSKRFYRELLRRNKPLGEALQAAKWDLVDKYHNPLGLLYTVYADPDLQVRCPPS